MSQVAESGAPDGTLGKKNLTTMHAVAQALAIGPMFSVALILGGVSRPDIGAGWNAALAVLFAGLGVVAIAYTISLYARKYAGAGAVYEYLTHGAHPWWALHRRILLRRRPLPRRRRHLPRARHPHPRLWTTHISDRGPAWWVWGDRARDRPRPELLRRPARDRRDAHVRRRVVHPDGDPGARDHLPRAVRTGTRSQCSTRGRRRSSASPAASSSAECCSASCSSSASRLPPRSARRTKIRTGRSRGRSSGRSAPGRRSSS